MKSIKLPFIILGLASIVSCGGGDQPAADPNAAPMEIYTPEPKANPNGVGPISELTLEPFDADLAAEGETVFTANCTACHKMDKRHVGPPLGGVLNKQTPAWVMNMILNPENMVANDPTAKALLAEYLSPMANQHLTEEQARAVIEYFRKYDQENPSQQ